MKIDSFFLIIHLVMHSFFYIEKIENYFLEDQRTIILNYFKQLFLRDKIDNQCISITRIQHT